MEEWNRGGGGDGNDILVSLVTVLIYLKSDKVGMRLYAKQVLKYLYQGMPHKSTDMSTGYYYAILPFTFYIRFMTHRQTSPPGLRNYELRFYIMVSFLQITLRKKNDQNPILPTKALLIYGRLLIVCIFYKSSIPEVYENFQAQLS